MELNKEVMCLLKRIFAPSSIDKFQVEPITLKLTATERKKL